MDILFFAALVTGINLILASFRQFEDVRYLRVARARLAVPPNASLLRWRDPLAPDGVRGAPQAWTSAEASWSAFSWTAALILQILFITRWLGGLGMITSYLGALCLIVGVSTLVRRPLSNRTTPLHPTPGKRFGRKRSLPRYAIVAFALPVSAAIASLPAIGVAISSIVVGIRDTGRSAGSALRRRREEIDNARRRVRGWREEGYDVEPLERKLR